MTRHVCIVLVAGCCTLPAPEIARGQERSGRRPNIIIFFADDLGMGDVACFGAKDIKTPNIDRLASEGMRLTNYYCAAPLCSPSRVALLTGRTPARCGHSLNKNYGSMPGDPGLPTEEVTFAEVAKTVGYATALMGKWHQGETPECLPNAQGFDEFVGFRGALVDFWSHMFYFLPTAPYHHDLWHNGKELHREGTHMTDLITEESIRFIEKNARQPFVLYAAYNAPHYPTQAQHKFRPAYARLPWPRSEYAAMVAGMDDSIGQILGKVNDLGLTRDTFVFFASDNGAADPSPRGEGGGSNAPGRDYKRSLFEGGIHMPAAVRWPGRIPAGRDCDALTIAMDILPTIAEIVGATLPENRVLDGRSWMPLFRNAGAEFRKELYFEWDDQIAVRRGPWKLVINAIVRRGETRGARLTGDDSVFLSNLETDPGEQRNLRASHPELVAEMRSAFDAWRRTIPAVEQAK